MSTSPAEPRSERTALAAANMRLAGRSIRFTEHAVAGARIEVRAAAAQRDIDHQRADCDGEPGGESVVTKKRLGQVSLLQTRKISGFKRCEKYLPREKFVFYDVFTLRLVQASPIAKRRLGFGSRIAFDPCKVRAM